ncbi:hypothetical protein JCM3774_004637 [Rhodotorula dairenensis]
MQSIRPATSRLARTFVLWPAATSSGCPRRLHSTLSPTRPRLAASRGTSHTDEANRSAILKRPRKLPPGAPTSQLFLDLLQVSPVRARPQLINEDSARALVKAWGVDKMHDVTVVDTYSGPGGLAKAYLELPNVKKVICIEDAYRYRPFLERLKREYGDRVEMVERDPFTWEAYSAVEQQGLLDDVPTVGFEQVHPNFFFSGQLPNTVFGQQLFVQLVSAIAGHMWYFQRGRMQMGFLGPSPLWNKLFAKPGDAHYHKLSVLLHPLAEIEQTEILSQLLPADHHFHRPRNDPGQTSAVKVTPRAESLVKSYDALEYVTRHMFVSKATPWRKALASIAPGAANLVPQLIEKGVIDDDRLVNQLTLDDWIKIADTFEAWPFRPTTLFDEYAFESDRI